MTSSNVPAALGKIATQAKAADKAVVALIKTVDLLVPSLDKVIPAIDKLLASFDVMSRTGANAFRTTARSAAAFSRTTIAVGDIASKSMGGVSRSLSAVRMNANQATMAVNGLARASRNVPAVRTARTVAAGVGAGAAMGSGGDNMMGLFGLAAAGTAGGTALMSGIKGAADLQQLQAQLKVAGMPTAQLEKMHDVALKMSGMTAQSVSDSMNLLKVMATSGVPLSGLGDLAMPIARYADVNYLATGKKHVEFEDSAIIASGLAHDLQIYDPKRMGSFLDTLYKASYQSGHGPQLMATQMRYYAARAKSAGLSDDDIVNLYPLIDRFGLGAGRGGSGVNMILKNLQDPRGKAKQKALEMMNVYDDKGNNRFIDQATGNIDLMGPNGFFEYVAKWRETMHLNKKGALANVLESRGFDTNAANILESVATKGGMEQLRRIRSGEKNMPGLEKAQVTLMSGLNSQTKLLSSNFHTLMTEIANPLIPSITKLIGNLATLTGNLAVFMRDHPSIAKATAIGIGGVAAVGGLAMLSLAMSMGGLMGMSIARSVIEPISRLFGKAIPPHLVTHGILAGGGHRTTTALAAGTAAVAGTAVAGRSLFGRAVSTVGHLTGSGVATAPIRNIAEIVKAVRGGSGIGTAITDVAIRGGGLFGSVIREFGMLRFASLTGQIGLRTIAGAIAKMGLRAIPVVGELLMFIDTLTFLGKHSKNIGYLVGQAFVLLMRVLPGIIRGGGSLAVAAMRGLVMEIIGVLNPANWVSTIGSFIGGINSAIQDASAKQIDGRALGGSPSPRSQIHAILHGGKLAGTVPGTSWNRSGGLHLRGMASGGRTTADGLAYLHRNEVVINDRLTRRLDSLTRPTGAGSRSGGSRHIHLTITIGGNGSSQFDGMSHRDLKRLSRMIAGAIGEDVEQDSRAGGAIPQLAGSSHYSVSKGRVT